MTVNKHVILTCSGLVLGVPGLHLTAGLTFPGSSLWHENLNLTWIPFAPGFTFSFPLRKKRETRKDVDLRDRPVGPDAAYWLYNVAEDN